MLNAGTSKAASMDAHTPEDFENLFSLNVRAPFSWCRSCWAFE